MKEEQPAAQHGSQRWLHCPKVINVAIVEELGLCPRDQIEWLSPLESDGFAEYRNAEFLERLDSRPLEDFWPRKGPQWDGLGLFLRNPTEMVHSLPLATARPQPGIGSEKGLCPQQAPLQQRLHVAPGIDSPLMMP